ncbi:MAG: CopD family protein [Thiobacillaceae bacterium]
MKLLYMLHVLSTVVWVGGMFFAYLCLRPVAASTLEPPQRLALWSGVFGRFFPWVWLSVVLLLVTGHGIILQMGGMAGLPVHIHVMLGIGYLMAAIFVYLYFVPYPRLRRAVARQDWKAGGAALNRIRILVATNLALGLANITLVFLLPFLI